MASIVIGDFHPHFVPRRLQPQVVEELADVLHLGGQLFPLRLFLVVPVVAVLFEHGTATGHVDHHGVHVQRGEGFQVPVGQLSGRFTLAAVIVDRSAADLVLRDDYVAPVMLQHAHRGPMHVGEHYLGHAAGKQGHAGAASSQGGGFRRQRQSAGHLGRQHVHQLLHFLGKQPHQPGQTQQSEHAQAAQPSGQGHLTAQPLRVGEGAKKQPAMEPGVACPLVFRQRLLHGHAERFDQPPVLHPGRTGRLTSPAIQAPFQVAANSRAERNPPIDHRPHQVDSPPGAVVLVAQFHIGRTGGRTQPAVDAVQKTLIGNLDRQRRLRRRGSSRGLFHRWVQKALGERSCSWCTSSP